MLRETTFFLGGALAIALGALLIVGLLWAGAGPVYLDAWLSAAVALVLGAFFLHVGREARRFRAEYLRAAEAGVPLPPGGPPV
ncbi:MAG TPA: hypothetical protein VML94_01740 [Thermoplasmata archaeon]|nr:hypothetical protein [Thermoplasmata archaeon]